MKMGCECGKFLDEPPGKAPPKPALTPEQAAAVDANRDYGDEDETEPKSLFDVFDPPKTPSEIPLEGL